MGDPASSSLAEVRRRLARVHREADLERQLRGYDAWAQGYEQDVTVLQYQAPKLAAACLASVFQGPLEDVLVLDVACGTGLVAQELQARGFLHFHGLDGSPGMLERARHKELYQDLKQCMLGQGTLPVPTGCYDAVLIVGALSGGHVPVTVIPELLRVAKPGGYLCLTTRSDPGNVPYKTQLERLLADLEQEGLWEKVTVQEVDRWERSAAGQETTQGPDYISGVIYLYRKSLALAREESPSPPASRDA